MSTNREYGVKMRLLKILFLIVEQPYQYRKKDIAERFQIDSRTVKRTFEAFEQLGLVSDFDSNYRYGFIVNKTYKQLKELLLFTEDDQLLLKNAIDSIAHHSRRAELLKRKLNSLYDYHKLGHFYLRKPYLERMNRLQQGIEQKRQVLLRNYRSTNSNVITDRQVEPFHINPPEDVVQCFDVDKGELRFFRMSRIEKIELLDEPWAYEQRHHIQAADPFRIVNNQQLMVHIRMKVGAYNDLLERFPLTKAYIELYDDGEHYDFQCAVNKDFIGLSNFLMGNWAGVDILAPESLRRHMNAILTRAEF